MEGLQAALRACAVANWPEAIKFLNQVIKEQGESADLLSNRAFCYLKLELNKHAIKDADRALAIAPADPKACLYKGQALASLGKRTEASRVWAEGRDAILESPGAAPIELFVQLSKLHLSAPAPEITAQHAVPPSVSPSAPQPAAASISISVSPKDIPGSADAALKPTDPKTGQMQGGTASPTSTRPTSAKSPKQPPRPKHQKGSPELKRPLHEERWTSGAASTSGRDHPEDVGASNSGRAFGRLATTVGEIKKSTDAEPSLRSQEEASAFSGKGGAAAETRLALGIMQVNQGNLQQAVAIFSKLIEEDPRQVAAYIGRGTALALQRKLEAAVADFSKAIKLQPLAGEAWKRRGQARAAMGQVSEALADLGQVLKLEPYAADALLERGMLYFRAKDYVRGSEDLKASLNLNPKDKMARNYNGLCLTAQGLCMEGVKEYEKAVKLDPDFKEAWTNMAQAFKEFGDTDRATESFKKSLALHPRNVHALRLWGLMRHGMGDHRGALEQLGQALQLEPNNLECRYLKASCCHALGNYLEAVIDYDACLSLEGEPEGRLLQYLAFYQREIALYTGHKQAEPLATFSIDSDFDPLFKEAWCKKLLPLTLLPGYKAQPVLRGHIVGDHSNVPGGRRRALLQAADRVGRRIQYSTPGFLKNARQHRMAGLAALEIAEAVRASWQAMREADLSAESVADDSAKESEPSSSQGSPMSSSRSRKGHSPKSWQKAAANGGKKPLSILGWRDVYEIAVRWRQLSEPCDPVVWVDMLSEKEFAAGFGSHTPLLLGQCKVVRYYPQFPRAFQVLKNLMLEQGRVFSASNAVLGVDLPDQRAAMEKASDCHALYSIVGQDFWITTPCHSRATPGKVLDGTRLTLQKYPKPEKAYELSIRTPGTPPRWAEYDAELAAAWEVSCEAAVQILDGEACLEKLFDSILTLSFFWYNFMPLARGTAVVGYVTLMGLFLASGMEITTAIPDGVQVDWGAILTPDVDRFIGSVKPWLYPSAKPWDGFAGGKDGAKALPKVSEALPSVRSVMTALSGAADATN